LIEAVNTVNADKVLVDETANSIRTRNPNQFRKFCRQSLHPKGISLVKAYRTLITAEDPVKSLSISWSMNDFSSVKMTFLQLHDLLLKTYGEAAGSYLDKLNTFSGTDEFIKRRKTAPYISGTLYYQKDKGEKEKKKTKKIHSPIFLFQNTDIPKHTQSLSYVPEKHERSVRKDKANLAAFDERLNIFYRM
jgi:pyruvate/2-oxoacid:ferredoxin oxidoreductase beta subunit